MHNALHGGDFNLTEMKMEIYEDVVYKNAIRNHLEGHDFVRGLTVAHFPQPRTPAACAACLTEGSVWVSFCECQTCSHIGCYDSSSGTHATRHYHEINIP